MSSRAVDVPGAVLPTHLIVEDTRGPAAMDAALSREVGAKEKLEAQNHERNEPENTIYNKPHGSERLSLPGADILGLGPSASIISTVSKSDGESMQGIDRDVAELEEPREDVDPDVLVTTVPLISSDKGRHEAEISEDDSSSVQISRRKYEKLPEDHESRRTSQSPLDTRVTRDTGEYESLAPDNGDSNSNGEGSSAPARVESRSRKVLVTNQTKSSDEINSFIDSQFASSEIPGESSQNHSENAKASSESIEAARIENASPTGEGSSAPGSNSARGPPGPDQKAKAKASPEGHDLDSAASNPSTNLDPATLSGYEEEPSPSWGESPHQSQISPSQSRHSSRPRVEFVVPRWQPDAEVTICPICRTQFSFFIRKHHCRKCGRVVCNSCSPHRITIPYQFIVQPPMEGDTSNSSSSSARPALDPSHAGSSSEFASLGGGERVRLCNPCVPDPNTAPPQTQFEGQLQQTQRMSHSRSASSVTATSYSPFVLPQGATSPQGGSNRPIAANFSATNGPPVNINVTASRGTAFNPHLASGQNNGSTYENWRESRSRSSTVSGHSRDTPANVVSLNTPSRAPAASSQYSQPGTSNVQPHYRSLVPRDEPHLQRPLPRPPRIPEEDECPVCHQELPSSALPDSESLRAAHINNCIEVALRGNSTSPPPTSTPPREPISNAPSTSSSTPAPIIANTPEARMAAREQAHAAIVLGRSSPAPHFRPTGVFPYRATEKDCVDDAECTICLEEFEVGDNMGRLECFCRFHLHCIRGWFVDHYGQCPVHQHGF